LRNRGWPTVACVQEPPAGMTERLSGSAVSLSTEPLNIRQAAAECDFAILNAGHNAVAQFLLAGKPLLLLPISLEQGILTRRLCGQGLAAAAGLDNPAEIQRGLEEVLNGGCLAGAVQAFAKQHAGHDPTRSQSELIDCMEARATASA
jgi:UDP:flavonoid glycosyltransferase YjiC (YdhE family)